MREIGIQVEVCLPQTEEGRRELVHRLSEIHKELAVWRPAAERRLAAKREKGEG